MIVISNLLLVSNIDTFLYSTLENEIYFYFTLGHIFTTFPNSSNVHYLFCLQPIVI